MWLYDIRTVFRHCICYVTLVYNIICLVNIHVPIDVHDYISMYWNCIGIWKYPKLLSLILAIEIPPEVLGAVTVF